MVGRPELFQEWNEEMEYMSGRIKVHKPLLSFSIAFPSVQETDPETTAGHCGACMWVRCEVDRRPEHSCCDG